MKLYSQIFTVTQSGRLVHTLLCDTTHDPMYESLLDPEAKTHTLYVNLLCVQRPWSR